MAQNHVAFRISAAFEPPGKMKIGCVDSTDNAIIAFLTDGSLRHYETQEPAADSLVNWAETHFDWQSHGSDSLSDSPSTKAHQGNKKADMSQIDEKLLSLPTQTQWKEITSKNPQGPPKPFEQLLISEPHQLILALSEGDLRVFDINSLSMVSRTDHGKGPAVMNITRRRARSPPGSMPSAAESAQGVLLVCVGVKKKVFLYRWDAEKATMKGLAVHNLEQNVRALEFVYIGNSRPMGLTGSVIGANSSASASSGASAAASGAAAGLGSSVSIVDSGGAANYKVCIGTSQQYFLWDLASGNLTEVFQLGKKGGPIMLALPTGGDIILFKDAQGFVVDSVTASASREAPYTFSDAPLLLSLAYPYLVAVLPNSIEIMNMSNPSIVQSISSIRDVKMISSPQSMFRVSTVASNEGMGNVRGQRRAGANRIGDSEVSTLEVLSPVAVILSTGSSLYKLTPLPLEVQTELLVSRDRYQDALSLAEFVDVRRKDPGSRGLLHDYYSVDEQRQKRISSLAVRFAYFLFNRGDYTQAMRYFQQSEVEIRQVLALYPAMLPPGQCQNIRHPVPAKKIDQTTPTENLELAVASLIPYLNSYRGRATMDDSKHMRSPPAPVKKGAKGVEENPELSLLSLVDTVLLKCYLSTDPRLVMDFLAHDNYVDLVHGQTLLLQNNRHVELVSFYRSHGRHESALECLASLEKSAHGIGNEETVKYLQQLGLNPQHSALVLKFSRRLLNESRSSSDQGLRIFTFPGCAIPPRDVLNHLKATTKGDIDILIAYLEAIIQQGNTDAEFHNDLISLYLEGIRNKRLTEAEQKGKEPGGKDAPSSKESLDIASAADPSRAAILRPKLIKFLETSQYYNASKVFNWFGSNDLLERAILYSRLGNHAQALDIYVRKMRDPDAAERYCDAAYNENEDRKDAYMSLLKVYLEEPIMLEPALSLLTKHVDRIKAVEALELLPKSTPIKSVLPFFRAVLSQSCESRHESQILRNLRQAENLQVRLQFFEARRGAIVIDRNTMCDRCHKKISKSAFARYPSGTIVHYICTDDKNVDPITGQRIGPAAVSAAGRPQFGSSLGDFRPRENSVESLDGDSLP